VRRAAETQGDDWQWEEIDWSDVTQGVSSTSGPPSSTAGEARGSSRVGLIPAAAGRQPSAGEDGLALIRRRRMVALALFGVLFASAIVIPVVVLDNGETVAEQTTPLTTSTQQATTSTRERPATTTTTQADASGEAPLRIALPENEPLRRGDRGNAVETLQRALAALGFATGEPDGVFGQLTQAAVIDFQQSNNLDPDGVVGTDTARLLNTALARQGVTE
jgi:hypothetical protein